MTWRYLTLASSALALLAAAGPALAQSETRCADVAACERALAAGEHSLAEAGFTALRRGRTAGPATLGLARLYLETGRYEEAARLARPLAARGAHRVGASTLLGEAEMARGRLDEAQAAFETVIGEASAHRARVMLGRLLMRRGRRDAARLTLMTLIRAYNDRAIRDDDAEGLTYVGMAAAHLGSVRDANDAFRDAARADPRRVETQLEWAELFLSKYDAGNAEEGVRQALSVNPRSARAHTLLARIKLDQSLDFRGAGEALDTALEIDPSHVPAHVTRASIAIRATDYEAADRHLAAALAVDPRDLEALSVRAALRYLQEDERGHRATVREVLDLNPRFARLYTIIAELADWEHRYPEIVEMAREALRIDPNDALSLATLGLNLLRMGQEEEGLAALRQAWRRDRYNVRVYNTLELYDRTIAPHYEEFTSGPFVFRMHRDERPLLERDITTLLRTAYDDMRRRYRFTPRGPIRIELFAEQEHFSVRTSGLPNIGVQGVCFGQVITALSPRAGPFNVGQITWHELAHVFHIQLSNHRVPRWFTEGLAEYETMIARPGWRRHEDHRLYAALSAERLPPIGRLNHAFTHARSMQDVMVAYYASTMVVAFIAERHGFDRLVAMLRAWGRGHPTERVIQDVLGVDIDALDRVFREYTDERLAARANDFSVDLAAHRDLEAAERRAQAAPDDAEARAAHGAAALAAGRLDVARQAFEVALRLDPAQPIALFLSARLALAGRSPNLDEAQRLLDRLRTAGKDGYEVQLLRARIGFGRRRPPLVRAAFEAAARIDPDRREAWEGLLTLSERIDDQALALRALTRLAELDPHDRASHAALLTRLEAAERWDDLGEAAERAIFVDPYRAETRRIYGESLLRARRPREALRELDLALELSPQSPGPIHAARARALRALRRGREAAEAERAAAAAENAR